MTRVSCAMSIVLFAGVMMATPARAQSTGAIQGNIIDAQGAVVPGVTVTVRNVATGSRADDGQRCERRLPDAVARARPLPDRDASVRLRRPGARRRGRGGAHVGREHPADRRRRGRNRERRRRVAGHRDRDGVGRPGDRAAHRAGDSAERPPLRRPRPADSGLGDAAAERLPDARRCAARARSRSTPPATAKTPSTS